MNLTDRLRAIVRPAGGSAAHGSSRSPDPLYIRRPGAAHEWSADSPVPGLDPVVVRRPGSAHDWSADPAYTNAADLLSGEWRESSGHRYLVVDRTYSPGHRHGDAVVVDAAPGGDGGWAALGVLEPALEGRRLLFVDLETTGLAGGAGTYAFLVGFGWFDGGSFRVRQLLLTSFAAERGVLDEMAAAAGDAGALATYNGKSFDVPLIETRRALHRLPPAFEDMPHMDLLHPARRLWRPDAATAAPDESVGGRVSCSLAAVEEAVLGYAREGDVSGFEIPSRYFHYVRSGDSRPLAAVLEHNRLDLLSLALLTARAAYLLEGGADAARTPREAMGLGRLYQRAGRAGDASACFARALSLLDAGDDADPALHADALRACAVAARRGARHAEAAEAWRRVLALSGCPPRLAQEANEALAIHHEHRLKAHGEAHRFALASLDLASGAAQATGLRHRLTRLERKMSRDGGPPRLFNG